MNGNIVRDSFETETKYCDDSTIPETLTSK